jgi:hypothetical protein
MHCGWIDQSEWRNPSQLPPQIGLLGHYTVREYMDLAPGGLCPGFLAYAVGVEEAAQGSVALEAHALETFFPTTTHGFLDAVMSCSQAFKRYGAAKLAKGREKDGHL